MPPTVLITGASSGIGAAFARSLAAQGHPLILVARREARLQELATTLGAAHGVRIEVVTADLARPEAIPMLVARVAELGMAVDWLVNNAGLGYHGPFSDGTEAQDRMMMDLNMGALTALSRAFLPGMRERRSGVILNVASTAAFQSIPYFAVYAATKAYVLSFSEALAAELAPEGIRVLCLCPGATETEFASRAAFKSDLPSRAPAMSAEAVVDEALRALKAGATVTVPGLLNMVGTALPKMLPRVLVTRVAGLIFKPTR